MKGLGEERVVLLELDLPSAGRETEAGIQPHIRATV